MLQKGILGLILILVSGWIILDLTEKQQLDLDAGWKFQHLKTLHSADQFEEYFTFFLSNISRRASLRQNYSQFLNIDPCEVNFQDSIKWELFIDEYDLEAFSEDIEKISNYGKKNNLGLDTIRNKMIYDQLLNYAVGKTWNSGMCCFGQYFINKDIYNNISLASHSCELYREKISINGEKHIAVKPFFSTTLPQANTLHIASKMSKESLHQALNRKDSIEFNYVLDVSQF